MEGVLARSGLPSLTRRHPGRARRPEAKGIRSVQAGAQACPGEAGSAAGARGRQRSCREPVRRSITSPAGGLARRSHRSKLRQDRVESECVSGRGSGPGRALTEGHLRGSREGRGKGRSWRFAVKRSSTWLAHPMGSRESSDPQGARDGSRLQKSVRRIFLVASAVTVPKAAVPKAAAGARDSSRRPVGL
jgi:hypothetical protein